MTWAMRVLPTGSFAWLVAHELRLNLRGFNRRSRTVWLGLVLLIGYVALGITLALGLRDMVLRPMPMLIDAVLAASVLILSFMTTQAILSSYRTLYDAGDLDLLLSAPVSDRTVLGAKLLGIAGTIVVTYAALLLPIVVPVATLGHPQLFGMVALLAALALTAASIGLALTLTLAWVAGPRAARTVGQIAAAALGGGFFLLSQFMSNGRPGQARIDLFERLQASRIGQGPVGALPGRAAFGDPVAIALVLGGAALLFLITNRLFQARFLASYQAAGMRLSRTRASRRSIARHFGNGLFSTILAKESKLLRRDPAILFQIVLRVIYLAPLILIGFGGRGGSFPLVATLAFTSVLVVGQLAGSFAWLTISAEDSPDLLTVAPVRREQIDLAKLFAALALSMPIGMLLPIAVAMQSWQGGVLTVVMTILAGLLAGMIELKMGKPMPRKAFNNSRRGGGVAGFLALIVTFVCGGITAVGVYFLV